MVKGATREKGMEELGAVSRFDYVRRCLWGFMCVAACFQELTVKW